MTPSEIRAELRRSAVEDEDPFAYCGMGALKAAMQWRSFERLPEFIGDLRHDDARTFFLLVAEAL